MKLQSKLFLGIGAVLSISLAGMMYTDTSELRRQFEAGLRADAHDIQALLMATRRVYQKQFVDSGLPINDGTIGFLPAHALSRISSDFSLLNEKGIYFNNVSDQPRNPDNRADSIEMDAIHYFRENPKERDRMVAYTLPDGGPAYHFAAPIRMEAQCLACHGRRENAPAGIESRYETGYEYEIGDLHGILSIKLPADRLLQQLSHRRSEAMIQYGIMLVSMFLLLGLAVDRLVVRRLVNLNRASDKLHQGGTTVLVEPSSSDEIGELGSNFNRMAQAVINREQQLRDRESLQRAVVESARDAILMADESGRIELFNPVACSLFGYQQQEIIGQPLTRLMPGFMHHAHHTGFEHPLLAGRTRTTGSDRIIVTAQHKDGTEFPIEMSLGEGMDSGRRIFVATVRDIRERLKTMADQQLAETAFENQNPMLITDARATIIRANSAFYEVTGYSSAEIVGQNPRILKSDRQDATFYRKFWQCLTKTGRWQGELWNRRKDGSIYPEWLSVTAVRNGQGEVSYYVGSFTDLSRLVEQRVTIERMAGEERTLGQLLRLAVSHLPMKSFLEASLETLFSGTGWLHLKRGGVFLADDLAHGRLRLAAGDHFEPVVSESCNSTGSGQCLCGRTVADVLETYAGSQLERHAVHHAGICPDGRYVLPLQVNDRVLGVMLLDLQPAHDYTKAEQVFLERVADVIGTGILRRFQDAEIEHRA